MSLFTVMKLKTYHISSRNEIMKIKTIMFHAEELDSFSYRYCEHIGLSYILLIERKNKEYPGIMNGLHTSYLSGYKPYVPAT